jgi:signal peptidase I
MTQPKERPPEDPKPENPWLEALKTVGLSAILALGIRQFVAEARFIPSGSMFPNLLIDDRLIVDKVSYKVSAPQRGDVIVFMPPSDSARCNGLVLEPGQALPKPKDAFIKRVIGLPGETVEVRDRQLFVNDQPIKENYTIEIRSGRDEQGKDVDPVEVKNGQVFINGAPEGDYKAIAQSNYPKTTVPKDFYLVMGDNRNNSCDGRFWGMVPKGEIIGKAVVRFWPLTRMGSIDIKKPYQP